MQTLLIIITILNLGVTLFLILQFRSLRASYGTFFSKKDPKSIESLLKQYDKDVKGNAKKLDELATFCAKLHNLSSKGLTKLGMVRFNPFDDKGGDQSFCLAALNRHLDGFVLSSIHTRTGVRLYAKEIVAGKSKYHLSDEEMRAIGKAVSPRED